MALEKRVKALEEEAQEDKQQQNDLQQCILKLETAFHHSVSLPTLFSSLHTNIFQEQHLHCVRFWAILNHAQSELSHVSDPSAHPSELKGASTTHSQLINSDETMTLLCKPWSQIQQNGNDIAHSIIDATSMSGLYMIWARIINSLAESQWKEMENIIDFFIQKYSQIPNSDNKGNTDDEEV